MRRVAIAFWEIRRSSVLREIPSAWQDSPRVRRIRCGILCPSVRFPAHLRNSVLEGGGTVDGKKGVGVFSGVALIRGVPIATVQRLSDDGVV
jgi:hypothetical protein